VTKFCLIGIALGKDGANHDTEDLSIVTDNLPHALRLYAERIEQGKSTIDLDRLEVLLLAGVSAEKAEQLETIIKT